MRTILLLIFLAGSTIIAYSQHSIGDVKYSALPPNVFTRLNPDWVLMDGGASKTSDSLFKKSKLHLDYKLPSLPDGRGVFIRGMNENRSATDGDPDGNRDVGKPQQDALRKHKHVVAYKAHMAGDLNNQNELTNNTDFASKGMAYTNRGEEDGGNDHETRPRNIPFYVYIKIN